MDDLRNLFLLLILFLTACDAAYIIEEEAEALDPEPVAISIVSPDSIPKVFLDITRGLGLDQQGEMQLLSEWLPVLESADVQMVNNTTQIPLILNPDYAEFSKYGRPFEAGSKSAIPMFVASDPDARIEKGNVELQVNIPDGITISGSTIIPSEIPVSFQEVDYTHALIEIIVDSAFSGSEYIITDSTMVYAGRLLLTIDDPANQHNFYNISLIDSAGNGLQVSGAFSVNLPYDPVYKTYTQDRSNWMGRYFQYGDGHFTFSDATFNGQQKQLELTFGVSIPVNTPLDEIIKYVPDIITLQTISHDFYKYLRTGTAQKATDELPFSEPVPIYSNMSNGLGVIGSYRTIFSLSN